MQIEVVRPCELTAGLDEWRTIQAANPGLASPFFAPEFAKAVAAERDDTLVAVIHQGGKIEGFFPFHRDRDGSGHPIGLRISDYHGVVATDSLECGAVELLRGCGLSRWDFRCVPVAQRIFEPWRSTITPTVSIDLSGGFREYHDWLAASGSRLLTRLSSLRRKAESHFGALRFTWHSGDQAALRALIECKSAQYRRTGAPVVLEPQWIVHVLERLHQEGGAGCKGVLSELRAGDQLMAAHFGIRSSTVIHYWFPCYRTAFARYSPGLMLLMDIARNAEANGISRIDLGFRNAPYKERFANAAGAVARGSIIAPVEDNAK